MIYTVTFNPALDYAVCLERLKPGVTNRAVREELTCGGKGINVSIMLGVLGVESRALGFLAGATGEMIRRRLSELGVAHDFIVLPGGMSRINVKLMADVETEINGRGPDIPPEALEALLGKLEGLEEGDTLVLAGSIPPSLPNDVYERILAGLSGRGVRFVVDAAGELLLRVLKYRPFLVKPNHIELGGLFGRVLQPENPDGIRVCAGQLLERGAENVLVSMGEHGAALFTGDGRMLRQAAARGDPVNSVGAGDSMVAGFLAGYLRSGDFRQALRLGAAAGGATAFSVGLAGGAQVETVLQVLP